MFRFLAAIFIANLLGGCHLIFPFHPAQAVDSGTDASDSRKSDSNLLDSIKSDTHPPDTFKPDIDLCKEGSCTGNSACNPANGQCQCLYAYGPAYPACNALAPKITNLKVGCDHDCIGGTKYDVTWTFTDAVSFSADLMWVSGNVVTVGSLETVSGNPITLASTTLPNPPPTYSLPATTTGTPTQHTIRWIMGGSLPVYLKVMITVKGPSGSTDLAERQVHVIN